ncbi:MAG TPA: cobalt ECF transporter T component CbiQ [Pseudonocardia sp.]|nr:cobalt ECF transporter T component CbiQ [Pseudonocardia sp.]
MHALDAQAYTNPWRARHPAEKAALAFGLVVCALVLPPWPGAVVVGGVALVLLTGPAGLTPRQVLRAVRVPLVFVAVGSLPLLVAVGGDPPVRWDPTGPVLAAELAGRATAALLCLILFAATTPLADALPRLNRIGVPPAVTEIAALIYRLVFLLLGTLAAVREAQAGRLGFRTWRTTYRSVACQAGAVFTRSFGRARAWEQGLALRGYTGSLRVQVAERAVSRRFLAGTAALLAGVVVTTLLLRGALP